MSTTPVFISGDPQCEASPLSFAPISQLHSRLGLLEAA